ncbi:formylglycine-generating enzyme family protein, partial [Xanthomonas sp. Kuri4-2]
MAGCSPAPEPSTPAATQAPAAARTRPSVVIGGEESAETVSTWQAPAADLGDAPLAAVRRRAAQALKEGRLFRSGDDAIPLYLAIQA